MKGATAVPCVITNKPPNIKRLINIGINQNFFLAFINWYISFKKFIVSNYIKSIVFQDYFFLPIKTNKPPSDPNELKSIKIWLKILEKKLPEDFFSNTFL